MTKSFPSITNLLYAITVTLTECLCQLADDYTQDASAFILWKRVHELWLAKLSETEPQNKKRKRKQNLALLRTSLSSAQETISLQFKNFRFKDFSMGIPDKKYVYFLQRGRRGDSKKKNLGCNPSP